MSITARPHADESTRSIVESELRELVAKKYVEHYPGWKDIRVKEITRTSFSGWFVVVESRLEDGHENEEVCFVEGDRKVIIFPTSLELARFIEAQANASLFQRVFNPSVLTGIAFLLLLLGIFVSGFVKDYNAQAIAILGSVVGSAGGFFFASERNRNASDAQNSN